MEYLTIDRQTQNDLSIFSSGDDSPSIFSFYDNTQTHGGKLELKRMMHSPLSIMDEIKQRTEAIKFIKDRAWDIELIKEEIEFIEHYLNQNILILKSNFIDSLWNWLRNKYKPSNEYFIISRGLEYLKKHLNLVINIIEEIDNAVHPDFFNSLNKEIDHIRRKPAFVNFLGDKKSKIPFWRLGRYDFMIRVKEKETIKAFMAFSYKLDAFMSAAYVASEHNLSFPEIDDASQSQVQISGMFHPFLNDPVKNDFLLQDSNLCFLSGANMSGKSTFLKSVGVCVYLAHLGFPVPASSMKHTIFKGLFSTINIADSIEKGLSHYYSEVKRVKEIALEIEKRKKVFVIFDELFRGTNVKDAQDATLLLARSFSRIQSSLFLISTHITEVAEALKKENNISFKCFHASLEGQIPTYDYTLREGVSSERLGLTILKNEKVLEILDGLAGPIQ